MTVLTFITDAYFIAGITADGAAPTASQGQKAVVWLNDMMASLAEDGIDVGYNPKASVTDALDLPLGAVMGLKAMLAVRICSNLGAEIPQACISDSEKCYTRLLGQAVSMQIERAQSNTLPCGENQRYGNILTG